jgi:hypothetical protein
MLRAARCAGWAAANGRGRWACQPAAAASKRATTLVPVQRRARWRARLAQGLAPQARLPPAPARRARIRRCRRRAPASRCRPADQLRPRPHSRRPPPAGRWPWPRCDVAEGLGQAGNRNRSADGVVRRQVVAAALAGEDGAGSLGRSAAQRPVAHQHQPGVGDARRGSLEGLTSSVRFFSAASRPTHITTRSRRPAPQLLAQRLAAPSRVEQPAQSTPRATTRRR